MTKTRYCPDPNRDNLARPNPNRPDTCNRAGVEVCPDQFCPFRQGGCQIPMRHRVTSTTPTVRITPDAYDKPRETGKVKGQIKK